MEASHKHTARLENLRNTLYDQTEEPDGDKTEPIVRSPTVDFSRKEKQPSDDTTREASTVSEGLRKKLLIQNSKELQDTKSFILAAEVKYQLDQQMILRQRQQDDERLLEWAVTQALIREETERKGDRDNEGSKQQCLRQELQKQFKERELLIEAAKKEAAAEARACKELAMLVQLQTLQAKEAKHKHAVELRREQELFHKEQECFREKVLQAEKYEDEKIAAYWSVREAENRKEHGNKQKLLQHCVLNDVHQSIQENVAVKLEEEALLEMLHAEMELRRAKEAKEVLEESRRSAERETMKVNLSMSSSKIRKAEEERANEKIFMKRMLAHLEKEEEHPLTQASQQRKASHIEHSRQVHEVAEYRRRLFEAIKQEDLDRIAKSSIKEEQYQKELEEEKERLLQEAAHLTDCFPHKRL